MKKILVVITFLMGLFLSNDLKAQAPVERSTDITKIGGKEYYLHRVKAGQTLYGLSEVYNVTIAEIETLNPEVKNGLKVGHVLGIPVRPVAEPMPLVEEPEPEPIAVEPEPVVVEPDPEPIAVDPEPVVVEPEPDPIAVDPEPVVVEPEPDPIAVEPEPVVVEPEPDPIAVEPEPMVIEEPAPKPIHINADGTYTVQLNEDLYDIAKKFGMDLADFKHINPGLTEEPQYGTKLRIPAIANENDYILHSCERNERVSSLLKRWKVDEGQFRAMNVSVGSHVFVNQVVLIPIQPIADFVWTTKASEMVDPVAVEPEMEEPIMEEPHVSFDFEEELGEIPQCVADPANARKRYHVALMVPLYLQDVDNLNLSKEGAAKTQKARALSFIQFYEGFMMAAESLADKGLKLDLNVFDVTDNVSTAERALQQIEGRDYDLIVGPFFGKSFNVIETYAKANGITVVNPLSNRELVIEDNPNVVKVKPGDLGLILSLSNLVRNFYFDSNVFIVSREKSADSAFLAQLEHHLNLAVNDEVRVKGDDFLRFARNESERLEMGSRLVPTLDVEGQVYSTDDFKSGVTDEVVISNSVKRYPYSEIRQVKSQLSGVRNNLIIAYGDENVFATQMLNTLSKEADRFPITLVCVHDWAKFEKLLVDNLLKMNAIYVSDYFVDYESEVVKRFVARFRSRYSSEPQQYAFQGYDLAMYFLTALQNYGADDLLGCLHCHQAPMMSTQYKFYYRNYLKKGKNFGKENLYWSIYQYDNENVELVPLDPFKQTDDNE
ncbi:MAG: LysM peptidoglycan-binding domain-containing protein [Bacteroidales bacterium]|nr:LysM peptidoglycan-binding domain-containing protein [Bacteroidales bacterium]